jgi:NTP pyrophosphatase (non-canonical NTP hydrolase)
MFRKMVLDLIDAEREKQDQKWGADRHLPPDTWFCVLGEEVGEVARGINEHDSDQLVAELIQVGAVVVAWLEDYFYQTK